MLLFRVLSNLDGGIHREHYDRRTKASLRLSNFTNSTISPCEAVSGIDTHDTH